ncbi:hypothetical protein Cni_G13673 [Canna indica]|uniref:Uncharacterized protein n=1 Tax=Canna indica TaxID=4628 RepID=A0AAQ3QDY8_9LILI|nr:hypothetical protein Cni_G13673 [Canna indica]
MTRSTFGSSFQTKTATKATKAVDDDDLWGPAAVPAPRTTILNAKPPAQKDDDDLWVGFIVVAAPRSTSKALNKKTTAASDDNDQWAAIAAPPPTTKAKPLSGKCKKVWISVFHLCVSQPVVMPESDRTAISNMM